MAYIPHSFSQSKPSKHRFNTACHCAIRDGKVAHKWSKSVHQLNLMHFIFLTKVLPSLFFNLPSTSSLVENVKNFQNSTPFETSGIWPKASLLTLLLNISLLCFILMAALPSLLLFMLISSFKSCVCPFFFSSHWLLRIFNYNSQWYVNLRKVYGHDGVPPIALKNCASVHAPYLATLF